jgi:hypothetical protein
MDDRGSRSFERYVVESSPYEHGESPGIVRIIGIANPVEALATVELRCIHEQRARAGIKRNLMNPDGVRQSADRDRKAANGGPSRNVAIARQRNGDAPIQPRQCGGERPEHVGKATCFREWHGLGTDDKHRAAVSRPGFSGSHGAVEFYQRVTHSPDDSTVPYTIAR